MNSDLPATPYTAVSDEYTRRARPRIPRTLHAQISLLLMGMLAALFLLAGIVLGDVAKREILQLSGHTLEEVGRQLSRELATMMSERYRNVALLAEHPELRSPAAPLDRKRALLESFQRTYPEFSWIGLTDAHTAVVQAATGGLLEGSNVSGRPVFDQAKTAMFVGDVHEAVRLANLMPRNRDGSPIRFVDIASPIKDDTGRTVGVLSTHLSWEWASRAREAVLRSVHQRLGLQLFVVNSGGDVLVTGARDVPLGKALADLTGAAAPQSWQVLRWADGTDYLTVALPSGALGSYPGLGWTVVARQPLAVAVDPVRMIARGFYVGSAAIVLVGLLLGWWVVGRIVHPMRELARAASQAVEDKGLPSFPSVQGSDEAATLLRAVRRFVETTATREARYRALIEATAAVVWTSDAHGALVARNLSWQSFTGQPASECAGWGWLDAVHPDDRSHVMLAYKQALQSGNVLQCEYRLRRHDGQYRLTAARAVPLRSGQGDVLEWIGTNIDITERRAAEAAVRERDLRLRVATEAAGVSSWCWDLATDRFHSDALLRALFDAPRAPSVDSYAAWIERVHPDDRVRIDAALHRAACGGQEFDEELRVAARSGERWVHGHAVLERDDQGHPRRLIGCAIDISKRKGIELALREADRKKDEFLAMLAHELRNPLAPLTNSLRLLERCAALGQNERTAVQMATRQARQMKRLVDDLLEVSRITQGKISLQCEPVSVAALVHAAADSLAPTIEARGQRLLVAVPAENVCINADHARLMQVLENLLNNASKYTDPGGEIRIRAEAADDAVAVTVSDNGMGIPADALPRLFDLFSQIDTTLDRSQGGLGIGLALVKRLIEMHGGTVSAASAGRGQGAAFTVRLPRMATPVLSV